TASRTSLVNVSDASSIGFVMYPPIVLCSKFCLIPYSVKFSISQSPGAILLNERLNHSVLFRCPVSTDAPLAIEFAVSLDISLTLLSTLLTPSSPSPVSHGVIASSTSTLTRIPPPCPARAITSQPFQGILHDFCVQFLFYPNCQHGNDVHHGRHI